MEYYAKSREHILPQNKSKYLLQKLEEVMAAFDCEQDKSSYYLLHHYKEKLLEGQSVAEQKTLQQHLQETVECAENFFHLYGQYFTNKEKKLILYACGMHDIGKLNYIFQTKVNPNLDRIKNKEIPHGFLSAITLSEKKFLQENPEYDRDDFDVLVTAIYYHHTRDDSYDTKELEEYCEQFYLQHLREYFGDEGIGVFCENRNGLLFSDQKGKGTVYIEEKLWCEYMLVKGMLNKFDWVVSAGYENAETSSDLAEKRLCRNIKTALNGKFRPAQVFMIENRNRNVVMIAPTGSGKTEAALMWIDGEKGFYTLPLKVSSNAIYQRIKRRYQYEDVALLHSDSMNSYLQADDDLTSGYKKYEQAKLLSYPLTVCTVDQLFKFVYKALGTEVFAATLKYSKIVIDEIQSYSPRVVAALIYGLSEIKRMGGRFAIITATLPPILQFFMEQSKLLEGRDYIYRDFSDTAKTVRHRLQIKEGEFDIDEIISHAKENKVLVICNTVSKAQHVYAELKARGGMPELLHSRFIREHRNIIERRIMDFSADETATGIWVTTQIVEASLDIDFDILYTEMCTADSLLQRMGRCNRAGLKSILEANVRIYVNGSGRGIVYDKDIYDRSVILLKEFADRPFSETDKERYINKVYNIEEIRRTQYFRQIEKYINHFKTLPPVEYDAEKTNKEFRAIQSITVIPDMIYEQKYEMIQSIFELMETSHVDKGVRKLLKTKMADMTLSLNITYNIPEGIDKQPMGVFAIHRTRLDYDFDGESGLGLVLNQMEEDDYIL